MKVVFLCNRLSRTKLRGSWQALLDASHGPVETQTGSVVGQSEAGQEREPTSKEVSGVQWSGVVLSTLSEVCCYCQVVTSSQTLSTETVRTPHRQRQLLVLITCNISSFGMILTS